MERTHRLLDQVVTCVPAISGYLVERLAEYIKHSDLTSIRRYTLLTWIELWMRKIPPALRVELSKCLPQ